MIAKIAAVFRLTALVTVDEITEPIRARVQLAATGKPQGHPVERLSYLITCHRCVSVWAGFVVLGLSRFAVGRVIINALALSQAEITLRGAADHLRGIEE